MIRLMLKIPLDNLQFGEMYIRKCDALDHPATMRGSTTSRIQRERSTTNSGHTI
jgi:hypothetical protein